MDGKCMSVKEVCEVLQQVMEQGKGDYEVIVNALEFNHKVTDWFDDGKKRILFLETEYVD